MTVDLDAAERFILGSARLLDRHRIPASFFMPAVSALLHPGEVRDYAAAAGITIPAPTAHTPSTPR